MNSPNILNYTSVAQDAVEAYGRAGADLLLGTIVDEIELSNRTLPLIEPTKIVNVDIRPIEPSWGGLYAYLDLEDLTPCFVFDPSGDPFTVLERLDRAGLHESAHRAHYQQLRAEKLPDPGHWFGYALCEGIAEYAVDSVEDELFRTTSRYAVECEREEALSTLIDLLYDTKLHASGVSAYHEFMYAPHKLGSSRGYAAARYAISLFSASRRYNTEQLMRTSETVFKEFVEHEL